MSHLQLPSVDAAFLAQSSRLDGHLKVYRMSKKDKKDRSSKKDRKEKKRKRDVDSSDEDRDSKQEQKKVRKKTGIQVSRARAANAIWPQNFSLWNVCEERC